MVRVRKWLSVGHRGRRRVDVAQLPKGSGASQDDAGWTEAKWVVVQAGPCSGARLYIGAAHSSMATGDYDLFVYAALAAEGLVLSEQTVWDVGAHVGYHSLALARLVGREGSVLAFEPNVHNLDRLRLHIRANPDLAERISVSRLALGAHDGMSVMQASSGIEDGTSSGSYLDYGRRPSDRHSEEAYAGFQPVQVEVARADTVLNRSAVARPSFAKIDVEGGEVEVLRGASELLSSVRPAMVIEVHNIDAMFHTQAILAGHNYRTRLLDDGVRSSSRAFVLAVPG